MPAVSSRGDERADLRKLQNELRQVELRLDEMRRRLPPTFDPDAEETFIRQAASAARVAVDVKVAGGGETVPYEDGRQSPIRLHRVEISGRDAIDNLEFFLELLQKRTWRLGDLDTLRIDREGGGAVRFTAQLVLPSFAIEDVPDVGGDLLASLRRRLAREQANLKLLESLIARSESGRLATALALLRSIPDDAAIHVDQVRVGGQMSLQGAIVGAAARAGFVAALQEGGFGASRIEIASDGACRPFTVGAQPGPKRPSVISRKAKDFDPGLAALCKVAAPRSLGDVAVRGKGRGSLNLRLRDVDVAGAFFVLHDLMGENFIIDSDVSGRINLDIENASLEETLASMRAAGLVVSAGPLHRVSLAGGSRTPAPENNYTGETVSFSLQSADVRDVLCLFTQITSLGIAAPAGLRERSAIFVKDLPWDRVMKELIWSVGLTYSIDNNRVFVGAERPGTNVCEKVAPASDPPLTSLRLPLSLLAASDLELVGRARTGESWKAYAYAPWRIMHSLETGQKLFDSRVRSIGPAGVTFEAESGRIFEISFDNVEVPALVGAWECASGPCIDPEIEFGIEDKVRVFRSWLHQRPASIGTWSVEGKTVTIKCCSDRTTQLAIVRVNDKELVLREEDEKEVARYRRIPD